MEAGGGWSGREAEMEDGRTEWEDGRGEKGPTEVERWMEAKVNGARVEEVNWKRNRDRSKFQRFNQKSVSTN